MECCVCAGAEEKGIELNLSILKPVTKLMQFKIACVILTFLVIISVFSVASTATHFECKGTARCLTGTVTKVKDGDTVVLNNNITVRLTLVDTPEKKDKIGWKNATEFTKKLCLNSTAKVDEDDKQKRGSRGRLVGVVYCGETNLNSALLESGLAKGYIKYCKKSEFVNENWVSFCAIKKKK